MKIYLVLDCVDYYQNDVISVWDSEQKAKEEVKRLAKGRVYHSYEIDAFELNAAYQEPKNGYKPWD